MKKPNYLCKLAALLSALLLAGGCIGYRSGVFDKPKPENVSTPLAQQPPANTEPPKTFMFGSKSPVPNSTNLIQGVTPAGTLTEDLPLPQVESGESKHVPD